MRRMALLAVIASLAVAPTAFAQGIGATPAGGTVAGIAFQDVNGDGQGPQEGETGLAGWVVWADLDGNGVRDAPEPSATAGADGRYSLGLLDAGAYTLRIQQPDGSACPQAAVCSKQVTVTDGATTVADFPIASSADLGRQLIDEGPVRIGNAKLALPRGCARKPFIAALTGSAVTRVDFRLDRRAVRSVRRPDARGRWTLRIDPRRLKAGRHTLVAGVFFSNTATKPQKQISASFRSCAARRTGGHTSGPAFAGSVAALAG